MNVPVGQRQGWIGRTLDERYEIVELLGEGGMGAVFKARHLVLDKMVAVKVVHPGLEGSAELAARFAREATVTSRLDHPNVISVSDSGVLEDGSAYMVMQYVRGPSLTQVLNSEGAQPWSRVAQFGAQLADALTVASAHGIVHRDLKPDNILLQQLEDGTELVKVLDFGIARFTRDSMAPPSMRGDKHNLTQTGMVVGTPGYMSPEQAMGEPASFRSDLYSLGVLLWECVVGQRLWVGDDVPAIVEKQLTTEPVDVRQAAGDPSIPPEFAQIVAKLLARRAADRPEDPGEVKAILAELVTDESSVPRRITGTGPMPQAVRRDIEADRHSLEEQPTMLEEAAAPQPPRPAPVKSAPSRRTIRPRSRTGWLFAFLLLAMVGGGATLVMGGFLEFRSKEGALEELAETMGVKVPEQLKALDKGIEVGDVDGDRAGSAGVAAAAAAEEAAAGTVRAPLSKLEAMEVSLVGSDTRTERVEAARGLLSHVPMEDVEPYIRSMAQLQIAETCTAKRAKLEGIEKVGDPRALPALHRLASRPKGGCGPKSNRDCLACLRRPLGKLIAKFEAAQLEEL